MHVRALGVSFLVAVLGGCGASSAGAAKTHAGPRSIPVTVETVEIRDVAYVVRATGTVTAFETVTIVAQVAGVVERVAFREGDAVTTTSILADIDPRRYELQASRIAAEVAEAEAVRAEAAAGLRNREQLAASGDGRVAADELEAYRAKLAAAEARVVQRKATLALADLDRERSRVRPPMAGDIQARLVQTGQQVMAGTPLATLIQRDPLQVRCTVTEEEGARLRSGLAVMVHCAGVEAPAAGKIVYVAAAVDPASRRIAVIADIAPGDAPRLRPGAFAEITIALSAANRPTVPQAAVRPSERGFLAYVIVDGKAEERVLSMGLRSADGRIEVRSGLVAGEQVVVRGSEAVRPGASVIIDGQGKPVAP